MAARDKDPVPASGRKAVSIVVPHHEDLPALDRCLAALSAQVQCDYDPEIIVADNASSCGTAEVERVIAGRAKLTTVLTRGAGPARNGGVQIATGEVLAFTDCDCEPHPSWLAEGTAALAYWDIVGGKMSVTTQSQPRTREEAFEVVFAFDNRRYVERCGFSVTANLFCARDTFLAVGYFGVGIAEDVDWCRRATATGLSLGYCDEAECGHPARQTWFELQRKWSRIVSEDYALNYLLRPLGATRFLIKALLVPFSAILDIPKVIRSHRLESPRELVGAIETLFKLRIWRAWYSVKLVAARHSAAG